jgi:hypothetical protein
MDDSPALRVKVSHHLVGAVPIWAVDTDIIRDGPRDSLRFLALAAEIKKYLKRGPHQDGPHFERRTPSRLIVDRDRSEKSLIVVEASRHREHLGEPAEVVPRRFDPVIPEESNLLSGLLEGDGRRFHSSPISRNGMPPKTAIRTGVSVWRRSTAAIIHATAVALSPESEEVSEIATSTRLSKEYPPRTAIHGAGCGADSVCGSEGQH